MAEKIKEQHKYRIVQLVRENGPISRQEISTRLNINLAVLSQIIKELLGKNLLVEDGFEASTGGRRSSLLKINPNYALVIGIEVSTIAVRASLIDLEGKQLLEDVESASPVDTKDKRINKILTVIDKICANRGDVRLAGVGVGISGIVSRDQITSLKFPQSDDWKNVPLGEIIKGKTGLSVLLENDVRAATFGELKFGAGQRIENFLYLHMGRGIGLGIVSQGRLHFGGTHTAGELGHIVVEEDGPICYCGNYGCLENLASPPAIEAQAKDALKKGVESSLLNMVDGKLEKISIQAILSAARANDRLAANLIRRAGEKIGLAVANLVNVFNPEVLILGGILSDGGELFTDILRRMLETRILPSMRESIEVRTSMLKEKATSIGAGALVFEDMFRRERCVL